MASYEKQPTQPFPQEKGKKGFEEMKKKLPEIFSADGIKDNGEKGFSVDGVELFPSASVSEEIEDGADLIPKQTSAESGEDDSEEEPAFSNGMSAQADWEKQKEEVEDRRAGRI